jgi:sec-independent protein translocase protein TatB
MFDIGFSELLLIGVVALVVIGPERLPKVARTAGQWLGKLNRYVSQIKQDIDRDMKLDEMRKAQQEMKDTAQRYEIMAIKTAREAEESVVTETSPIREAVDSIGAVVEEQGKMEWGKVAQSEDQPATPAAVEAPATPEPVAAPATPPVATAENAEGKAA